MHFVSLVVWVCGSPVIVYSSSAPLEGWGCILIVCFGGSGLLEELFEFCLFEPEVVSSVSESSPVSVEVSVVVLEDPSRGGGSSEFSESSV